MSDRYFKTGLISLFFIFLLTPNARGQIIPDNTLGNERSTVQRNVQINGINSDRIEGGARRGGNLFHSFREFNIDGGRGAYFSNPTGINNILTRVTGGNVSNILGTLGVDGSANLYLINPNGIYFGNGARLDVRGSFTATTADGIKLGNNDVFSAIDPGSSNLLSVQPGALFTNAIRNTPRVITNQGTLQVDTGQNLTLSADKINNNGSLIAPGGNIFLEAVNGDINTNNIDTVDPINGGGNISLFARNNIVVNGGINSSGIDTIFDESGRFEFIEDQIASSGDVKIEAGKNILFKDNSNLLASGNLGGKIEIKTRNRLRLNNSFIENISIGHVLGKTGDITIKADSIDLIDTIRTGIIRSGIGSETIGKANGGDINITANSLRIEGAVISTNTIGLARGGNINITANSFIELIDKINIINIRGGIAAQTFGDKNAGNINLKTDFLYVDGAAISASSFSFSERENLSIGSAGNININAKNIEIKAANDINFLLPIGGIISETYSGGNAGKVTILAEDILLDGARISTSTAIFSTGDSGTIRVISNNLNLKNGGFIAANNFGSGIDGNIIIKGQSLSLNNAAISTTSRTDRGGNIDINLNEVLTLSNSSAILAFDAGFLQGEGEGGNITINSPLIIASSPTVNLIGANAFLGDGGNININTRAIFGYPQFLTITADSELAIDGEVNINGLDNNITQSAIALPSSPLSAEEIIANDPCEYKNDAIARGSSFTIIGKGGIAPNPLESLEDDRPIVEWTQKKNTTNFKSQSDRISRSKPNNQTQIQQAVGWWRKSDGTVILTANPDEARPLSLALPQRSCDR